MSLQETKQLLREHRIAPNKLLGQNFMVNPSIFPRLSSYASLSETDTVLDVGAGFGFLTRFVSSKCKKIIAVEKDPHIAEVLREQTRGLTNVTVVEGDVLKMQIPFFNKVISIPPYYLSSRLLLWLFDREFDCAVVIFQKEFAERLVAPVGIEDYSWLTVFTYYNAEVELLDIVPASMFFPSPEVDSIILRLTPWKTAPFEVKNKELFKQMVRMLFTQRNKKVANAIEPFIKSTRRISRDEAKSVACSLPFHDKRVRELSPKDFGELSNELTN